MENASRDRKKDDYHVTLCFEYLEQFLTTQLLNECFCFIHLETNPKAEHNAVVSDCRKLRNKIRNEVQDHLFCMGVNARNDTSQKSKNAKTVPPRFMIVFGSRDCLMNIDAYRAQIGKSYNGNV